MVDDSSGKRTVDLEFVRNSSDGDSLRGLNNLHDLLVVSLVYENFVVELFGDLSTTPLLLLSLGGVSGCLGNSFFALLSSNWLFSLKSIQNF